MEYLVVWLLCGIAAGMIGARKGEGCSAFFLGVVFGPFGILIALFSTGDRKRCLSCWEYIGRRALICPRCQSKQPPESILVSPQRKTTRHALFAVLGIVIIAFAVLVFYQSSKAEKAEREHQVIVQEGLQRRAQAEAERVRLEEEAARAKEEKLKRQLAEQRKRNLEEATGAAEAERKAEQAAQDAARQRQAQARVALVRARDVGRFPTVEAAQREAVRRYPALTTPGSPMHTAFLERRAHYQAHDPLYFQAPAWPLLLAAEVAPADAAR